MIHGICLANRETFLAIHVPCSIHHTHLIKEILHSTNQSATGGIPVQVCTGKLFVRSEERIGSTTIMPMSAGRTSTMNSFLPAEILWLHSKDCKYRSFSSIIPHTFDVFMLEDKIQNPGEFLFRFSLGSNVMDQRSGDGLFFGRVENARDQLGAVISRILKCWTRRLLLLRTKTNRNPSSRRRSVSRNKKPRKRTGFFVEDRSPS